jgi:mRNA interferase RelE/StbE
MRHQIYTVEWDRKAAKVFGAIKDQKLKDHILDAIEHDIARDPFAGKPLAGPFKGIYSHRIGVIRILYKPYKDRLIVVVLDIGHRREIYR